MTNEEKCCEEADSSEHQEESVTNASHVPEEERGLLDKVHRSMLHEYLKVFDCYKTEKPREMTIFGISNS